MSHPAIVLSVGLIGTHVVGCKASVQTIDHQHTIACTANQGGSSPQADEKSDIMETMNAKFVSVVETLDEMDDRHGAHVEVGFVDHAAVFDLQRDHPCFASWLRLLKQSERERTTIVFTFGTGARITSVESGNTIAGIVETIRYGAHGAAVGFRLPDYADIFLIPKDHPRLADWLVLLQKSQTAQIKLVFAYDPYRHRVTSLALAEE